MEVTRILITGGISSGKSRSLDELRKKFLGKATFIPEAATLLLSNGYPPPKTKEETYEFQDAIMRKYETLIDIFERINVTQQLPLVFYDRSPIDFASFWPDGPGEFFRHNEIDPAKEAARYDAIICLQTVAATGNYNQSENNNIRFHTREEAMENDELVRQLYQGYKNVYFLNAQETFEKKMGLIEKIVERYV